MVRKEEVEGGKGEQRQNPIDDIKEFVDIPSVTGSYCRVLNQENGRKFIFKRSFWLQG